MSGSTSIVQATPEWVAGTFGAKDVRLGTHHNMLPGLFEVGDFAVSQRGAGANMSVDIAQGRAVVDPQSVTHQGLYGVYRTSGTAYNTSADGAYSWTAADATNPRIDLIGIELKDTAEDGSGSTGWRFKIIDGTPNASATHQLITTYWPAIPSNFLPLAAIKISALATTISDSDITNLNPICSGRHTYNYVSTAETTTSTSYARLSTPDFVFMWVPANATAMVTFKAQVKHSTAAGNQGITMYVNSTQMKRISTSGAPVATELITTSFSTTYGFIGTQPYFAAINEMFDYSASSSDVSEVTTGLLIGATGSGSPFGHQPIESLSEGWYVFEVRYKTSAGTITSRERLTSGYVVG